MKLVCEKIYNFDDVICFGRYNGKTINEVITIDPSWLVWADGNVLWFRLHEDIWSIGRLLHFCKVESAAHGVLYGERQY